MESHGRRHLTLCEGTTHQRQTGESRGWALEHSDIWMLRRFGTIYVFWEEQPVRRRQECSIFVILTESDDLMDKSSFKARLDLISRSLKISSSSISLELAHREWTYWSTRYSQIISLQSMLPWGSQVSILKWQYSEHHIKMTIQIPIVWFGEYYFIPEILASQ